MIKNNLLWIVVALIVGGLLAILLFSPKPAGAISLPKVDICHFDGQSGNFQTLNIAVPAAIAHLAQHEKDYSGACNTPIDVCYNLEGIQESTPEGWTNENGKCCPPKEQPKDYCDTVEGIQPEDYDCPDGEEVTPTPEVTPPEEPKGGPSDESFAGSSTEAPAPRVCTVPFEVARTWYDKDGLHWANDAQGIQKFSITYGPDKDHLIYGIDNIPATSRGIAKPESDFKQTWFSVWTWVDNCANQSPPIDP